MKITAIIQARSTSSRLPNKVLLPLPFNGQTTVLEQVVRRARCSKRLDEVLIATTINASDDAIVELCEQKGIPYFRGSEENVLERYYLAAKSIGTDYVVRITSDCPCMDAEVIDRVIDNHFETKADFTSNATERTFPYGIDLSIFSFKMLEEAYQNAQHRYEKEHVTTYFYKTRPDKFRLNVVKATKDTYAPDIRVTLDTQEDYTLLCIVYDYLYSNNPFFDIHDILGLFEEKPWLKGVNNKVHQKLAHKNLESELEEVKVYCKQQDLEKALHFITMNSANDE
ncbi:MAG: glycosyltransferase family protein [Chitinophagales bacterium]